jgi:hypothetical protein
VESTIGKVRIGRIAGLFSPPTTSCRRSTHGRVNRFRILARVVASICEKGWVASQLQFVHVLAVDLRKAGVVVSRGLSTINRPVHVGRGFRAMGASGMGLRVGCSDGSAERSKKRQDSNSQGSAETHHRVSGHCHRMRSLVDGILPGRQFPAQPHPQPADKLADSFRGQLRLGFRY